MGKLTFAFLFLIGLALTSLPAWFFVLFCFCLASQKSSWTFWISSEFVMYLVKLMLPRWSHSGLNKWIFFPSNNLQSKKSGKASSPHSINFLKTKIHTHKDTHHIHVHIHIHTCTGTCTDQNTKRQTPSVGRGPKDDVLVWLAEPKLLCLKMEWGLWLVWVTVED